MILTNRFITTKNGNVVQVGDISPDIPIIDIRDFEVVKGVVRVTRSASVIGFPTPPISVDHAKIAIIQFVREQLNFSFGEAKDIVEAAQEECEKEREDEGRGKN
jgi:hypothetical protein